MIKRLMVCVLFVLSAGTVWAAPVAPIEVELTQPDTGEIFWARPRGNEYRDWMETTDGYTILQGPGGVWYYADLDGSDNLISTGIRVEPGAKSAPAHLPQHLQPQSPDVEIKRQLIPLSARGTGEKSLVHTQNVLVIIVDFADITTTYSDASFQSLIFGATDSVKEYFLESSYNNFTITPAAESYGTANDGIVHIAVGSNHPNLGNGDWRASAASYVTAADGFVNYASFDTSANGSVSADELAIIIITAGYENSYGGAGATQPRAWGHQWNFNPALSLDAVTLSPYGLFGERHEGHQATIGIMCHELGHLMFGLPDLYDSNSGNGTSAGIGDWGLMGAGSWNYVGGEDSGETPAHLSAWSKAVLDITTPDEIDTASTGEQLFSAHNNDSIKLLWNDFYKSPRGEYFLIENRQLSGYDAGLPGAGLLIWHIDASQGGNGDETHKLVDLEEADGLTHLDDLTNQGDGGDPFPGTSSNVTFNDGSTPNSNDYASQPTGVAITNISASAATMTADLSPMSPSGDNIYYDEYGAVGWASGYTGQTMAHTALRILNTTSMDTIDGFEVYVTDATATIEFRWYESLSGTTPTNLLHTESGFAATAGWNRFLLATPQSFPASSERVMVLQIVNASYTFPAAYDASGPNSGRSYIDFDGVGVFATRTTDWNQMVLLSSSAPAADPVADFSSASYAVNESDGTVTVTVNLDVAPATACSVQYATSNGTATEPGDYTSTSGTLNFGPEDTSDTFQIPIVDDGSIESPETITVTLSSPVDCTLAETNNPATVTITSNDVPMAAVYANFSWTGGESGSQSNPYNTLSEALAGVSEPGTIYFNGGAGDVESGFVGTIDADLTLDADPVGAVRIGVSGGGNE